MGLTRINFGQISSANVDAKFEDPTLLLNYGQTGENTKDAGIIIERGSDSNVGFIWDESEGTFALINTSGNGAIRGNVTVSSYADLIANNVVVDGNLTVNGTTTTLNTSTLDVEDINLTIAKGASNSAAADGAGITIEGADATILWSDTAGKLVFNKSVTLGSNTITANAVVGDGSGLTGLQSMYYTASATPPGSAKAGDIWLDTDTGIKYTYFTDEDTSQWVEFDALNAFGNYAIEGGGGGGLANVVEDTTPQLGGDLDLNSSDITGTGNINITGTATISSNLTVDTNTLFVDATNNRVGIGTISPAYQVEIENTGSNALLVLDRTDGAACFIEGQATRSAFGSVGATPLALAYNSYAVVLVGANGAITVNPDGDGFTFPTTDGANGQVLTTDGNGNLSFQNAGGGGSGLTAWSVENSAVTAASGDRILVDVSSAAVTVTLPSSPSVGDEVRIVDAEGNAGTNNITVARNGSKITGLDENLVIDVDNGSVELVYYSVSRGWIIV